MKHQCPCCGFLTLSEKPGSYEICPVCLWEDDPVQRRDPELRGANRLSLLEARANVREFGVSDNDYVSRSRLPLPEEIPGDIGDQGIAKGGHPW